MSFYYWNTSDNKDHTHHRIEWAVANGILVCMNISVSDKLLDTIKPDDIILAYEPKSHKISKDKFGKDGYCCACKSSRSDGRKSFTAIFKVIKPPYKISTIERYNQEELEILENWYTSINHCYGPGYSNYQIDHVS